MEQPATPVVASHVQMSLGRHLTCPSFTALRTQTERSGKRRFSYAETLFFAQHGSWSSPFLRTHPASQLTLQTNRSIVPPNSEPCGV